MDTEKSEQKLNLVFISYSHQDKQWVDRVRLHLKPLEQDGRVEVWDDTRIKPGSKWKEKIEAALNSSRVAVLLISANYLASDFITTNELPQLLNAAEKGGTIILPLILSPSRFSKTNLSQFQTVNNPNKPLDGLTRTERERELVKLTEAIEVSLSNSIVFSPEESAKNVAATKVGAGTYQIPKKNNILNSSSVNDDNTVVKKERPRLLGIDSAIWVAVIGGLVALTTAYWQFIYKPGQSVDADKSIQYTGRVTDAVTNKPVHNAKISIEEDQKVPQIQRTDSEGIFHLFLNGSTKAVRIKVEADKYEVIDRNVPISRTGIEPLSIIPVVTPTPIPTPISMPISTPTPKPRPKPSQIRLPPKPSSPPCTARDMALRKC